MNWKPFALLAFALLVLASCSDDDEALPTCSIDDFVGTWNMNEQCDSADAPYQLTITKLDSFSLRIENIGDLGAGAQADVVVNGSAFTMTPQVVQAYFIGGNGSLNAGCARLTMSWQGGPNGECAGTATK